MTINHWQQRQKSIESGDVESRDALALSQSRKATAKSHSILWITAGVRRSATLMLMRGVTELFNKRRLNSAARYTAAAYGLLMHYSSANAATCTVVARRCCALTWPKLRRHQGGQKRSKPTWMLTPRIRVHPCSRETCMDAETSPSRFELLRVRGGLPVQFAWICFDNVTRTMDWDYTRIISVCWIKFFCTLNYWVIVCIKIYVYIRIV